MIIRLIKQKLPELFKELGWGLLSLIGYILIIIFLANCLGCTEVITQDGFRRSQDRQRFSAEELEEADTIQRCIDSIVDLSNKQWEQKFLNELAEPVREPRSLKRRDPTYISDEVQ